MRYINRLWQEIYLLQIVILSTFLIISSTDASAKNFKAKDLQTFTQGQRDSFYSGVVMALGHVVYLRNKTKGNCIWNWYYNQPKARITQIETAFGKYANHSPTAIIIGLLQVDCGKIHTKE